MNKYIKFPNTFSLNGLLLILYRRDIQVYRWFRDGGQVQEQQTEL